MWIWLLGCTAGQGGFTVSESDPSTTKPPPSTDEPTSTTGIVPTTDTPGTTDTGTPPEPTATTLPPPDCANLEPEPLEINELGNPRGYHGLAFDLDGRIIGSDNNNLAGVTHDDVFTVLGTGLGTLQQMDWLPDGNLAFASQIAGGIITFDVATGTGELLNGDMANAYGVVLGPDGKLWTADSNKVERIDLATGEEETFLDNGAISPHAIGFNLDFSRLYIGTIGGDLWYVELDEFYERIGEPVEFVSNMGGWHDCVVVDACDNVYVCDFTTSSLYRISPDGQEGTFVNWNSDTYGHGAVFGNGVGGWRKDAIYLPQPYDDNTVVEVVLGIGAAHP